MICWKHKHKVLISTLIPLSTGDVFGLPIFTALALAYSKDKGIVNIRNNKFYLQNNFEYNFLQRSFFFIQEIVC